MPPAEPPAVAIANQSANGSRWLIIITGYSYRLAHHFLSGQNFIAYVSRRDAALSDEV